MMNQKEKGKLEKLNTMKEKSENIKKKAQESVQLSKDMESESRKYLAAINIFIYGLLAVGVIFLAVFLSRFLI